MIKRYTTITYQRIFIEKKKLSIKNHFLHCHIVKRNFCFHRSSRWKWTSSNSTHSYPHDERKWQTVSRREHWGTGSPHQELQWGRDWGLGEGCPIHSHEPTHQGHQQSGGGSRRHWEAADHKEGLPTCLGIWLHSSELWQYEKQFMYRHSEYSKFL